MRFTMLKLYLGSVWGHAVTAMAIAPFQIISFIREQDEGI